MYTQYSVHLTQLIESPQLLSICLVQEHILALPEELLTTPFGQMLAPMLAPLEKRLGTIQQQPAGTQPAVPLQGQQLTAALAPDHAQVTLHAALSPQKHPDLHCMAWHRVMPAWQLESRQLNAGYLLVCWQACSPERRLRMPTLPFCAACLSFAAMNDASTTAALNASIGSLTSEGCRHNTAR